MFEYVYRSVCTCDYSEVSEVSFFPSVCCMCVWVLDETTLGWPWLREKEGWSGGEDRRVKEDMWLGRHPPPFLRR